MSFEWLADHDRAAIPCMNDDPELWHEEGINRRALERIAEAKAACRTCPARQQCLDEAMKAEEGMNAPRRFGIYGAKDKWDRAELAGFRVHRPYGQKALRRLEQMAAANTTQEGHTP